MVSNDRFASQFGTLWVDTGLLQFGRFQQGTDFAPFRFSFEYLPAYPDVLKYFASTAQEMTKDLRVDRLVATADSIPFGMALSLQTNIPLVYSRGVGQDVAYDIIGSYNVGHQALLVTNTFDIFQTLNPFIARVGRVGLHMRGVVTLVDFELGTQTAEDVPLLPLVHFAKLIDALFDEGCLSRSQLQEIKSWQMCVV